MWMLIVYSLFTFLGAFAPDASSLIVLLPESPHWLESWGRPAEAEEIMAEIEQQVETETHKALLPPKPLNTVF
jgi:hypothetical protein